MRKGSPMTWILMIAVALAAAFVAVAKFAGRAKHGSAARETYADLRRMPASLPDASATDLLRRLLAMPATARSENWVTDVEEQLPYASLRLLDESPTLG